MIFRYLAVLIFLVLASSCGGKDTDMDQGKFLFKSESTILQIPSDFLFHSDGWWNAGASTKYDRDKSVLLKMEISGSDNSAETILFIIYPANTSVELDIRDELNIRADLINKEKVAVKDDKTNYYRAYISGITFRWFLLDKQIPISADNIVGSCVKREVVAPRCRLIDFFPVQDVGVSLSLNESKLGKRTQIKEQIVELIRSWKQTEYK